MDKQEYVLICPKCGGNFVISQEVLDTHYLEADEEHLVSRGRGAKCTKCETPFEHRLKVKMLVEEKDKPKQRAVLIICGDVNTQGGEFILGDKYSVRR